MKVAFYTLGCKVNYYETQAMEELFREAGYEIVEFGDPADIYVVNTCSVTQVSDKKSRQMLSRAHKMNPSALVAAVGCYSELARETVLAMEGVSLVIGTEKRRDIVTLCEQALEGHAEQNAFSAPLSRREFEDLSAVHESRTRAVLKIQDGCSSFCSYCVIPFARGPRRSRSIESCENELRMLEGQGYKEIVLTGIQLSEYGADMDGKYDLCDVIRLCDSMPGIHRVRLGSLDPRYISDRFIETCRGSSSLCHHFHLSLQSGSDSVLKRMNRKYTTEEYLKAAGLLQSAFPDTAITTDIIAGFAGETDREHRETIDFVRKVGFSRIHVFPFSRRKHTRAYSMPDQVEKAVKEARVRELISVGNQLENEFVKSMIGHTAEVLMEDDQTGYSRNYVRVQCSGAPGELKTVRIVSRNGPLAIAEQGMND